MNIVALIIAALVILFGLRLTGMALQTAFTGKILVRRGMRGRWEPAATHNEALKIAIRDGLLGILLVLLGVALIT